MNMINRLAVKAEVKAFGMRAKAADVKTKISEKVHNKKFGAQEVVVALVLVVVAVGLCFIFKEQASGIIKTVGKTVTDKTTDLASSTTTTTP